MILIFILFLIIQPFKAGADIYGYEDKNGTLCFTDSPISGKKPVIIYRESGKAKKKKNRNDSHYIPVKYNKASKVSLKEYQNLIHEEASRHSINPELIKTIISVESAWNPYAVSKKGAMGLMQIMPETASELNLRDPFDPEENIRAGIRYLKYLLDRFNGDLILAIAAYNAGPRIVERFGRVPPIKETLEYVRKVLLSNKQKNMFIEHNKKRTKKEKIYVIKLSDGSLLYTNSSFK